MLKCSRQDSEIDKDTIEMKHIELTGYSNEVSDVSDCAEEDEDRGFVLTDILSFSWQIEKEW